MSAGLPFLHWAGSGRPLRVLYIDSEMPPTLMAARAEDATHRLGEEPTGISILPKLLVQFPPLNTRAGQGYMDALIEKLEAEFVVFDNIRYLLAGDIAKPEAWEPVNPWVLGLTSRGIGQMWLHHTGWNTTHGYGDSTKEWNFDTVMLMGAGLPSMSRPVCGSQSDRSAAAEVGLCSTPVVRCTYKVHRPE